MRVVAAMALVTAAAACAPNLSGSPLVSQGVALSTPPSPSGAASLVPRSSLTLADATSCAVTTPTHAPATISDALFGSGSAYGNDALWVGGLGDDGVILVDHSFVNPDGSIGWKFGWYRFVSGELSIAGRRLDADAPPLRPSVSSGYGPSGFQASGIDFSTEGCWEVTGSVGSARLTFVTFVVRSD